jgi:hypothetical protein
MEQLSFGFNIFDIDCIAKLLLKYGLYYLSKFQFPEIKTIDMAQDQKKPNCSLNLFERSTTERLEILK